MTENLYIGLMSGTSLDCIDAVLVRFSEIAPGTEILAQHEHKFPETLRSEIETAIHTWDKADRDALSSLDIALGQLYAESINVLLQSAGKRSTDIVAIGCHGQTVSHQPDATPPFSLQLGDGATIATETGITVINNFRSADIELGGQGAPLVPAFHEWAFETNEISAVVNIGGIANITILNPKQPVCGFDTGPGNTLLDHWCRTHTDAPYDKDGRWANAGTIDTTLLTDMLADPYFSKAAPKSTGREYFNSDWLQACLARRDDLDPVDVQATLLELTAKTIAATVSASHAQKLFICGGGALNTFLMERISKLLDPIPTTATDVLGIPALWVEAVAFAWLAKSRLEESPAGRPSVTGARESALLGNIHQPSKI